MAIGARKWKRSKKPLSNGVIVDANTVRANSTVTRDLDGTDVPRGANQLIRYTRLSTQTVTPTNQYGVEIVISLATGKVLSVNNRVASGSTAGTPIPEGAYVLSGHGVGANYAGQWLLDNAPVGASIELLFVSVRLSNFVASALDTSSIRLTWSYSGPALASYSLQRNGVTVSGPGVSDTSFVDNGLAPGTNYSYTLTGIYADGTTTEQVNASATTNTPVNNGTLPAHILSIWHNALNSSNVMISQYPADIVPLYNFISLGMAQGAGTDGSIYLGAARPAQLAQDVRALVTRGLNVAMGIGGAGSTTRLNTTANADVMFNSIVSLKNQYGFNGIDFDIEDTTMFTPQAMAYLGNKLKATYGSSFIIVLTPALYGTLQTMWLQTAQLLGDNFDFMAPMLYDFPECTDSRLSGVCIDKCNIMAGAGIPDNKMVLGFSCSYTGEANVTPNPQTIVNAYAAVKAVRPQLRGAFVYDDNRERFGGFAAVKAVAPAIFN